MSASPTREEGAPPPKAGPFTSLIAGFIAGTVSRTATAPLDRIKVLAQEGRVHQKPKLHPTLHVPEDPRKKPTSFRAMAVHIYRDGGAASFWRGNGANCLKAGPELGLVFCIRTALMDVCGPWTRREVNILPSWVFHPGRGSDDASDGSGGGGGAAAAAGWNAQAPRLVDRVDPADNKAQLKLALITSNASWFSWLFPSRELSTTQRTIIANFVTSAAAGAAAQLIVYPLETTKTRIAVATSGEYSGIVDCVRQSYARGGVRDFYKGLGANLTGIVPYRGLEMGCFFTLQNFFVNRKLSAWREHAATDPSAVLPDRREEHERVIAMGPSDFSQLSVFEVCGVGMVASIVAQTVTYPLNLVRTRLQTQGVNGRPAQYKSMTHCFQSVLRADGIPGLFRGLGANFLKAVPASVLTFVIVDRCQRYAVEWQNPDYFRRQRSRRASARGLAHPSAADAGASSTTAAASPPTTTTSASVAVVRTVAPEALQLHAQAESR